MSNPYQVIIVGGGPVGVGLAIELGQRDISVALIERYPQPQPIPKGQNLTQRTVEHFHFWGIENELRAARVMPRDYPTGGVSVYGDLNTEHWLPWLHRGQVMNFYYTANERLPQYATEAVLRNRVAELDSVDTFYGWSATKIEQNETGVTITAEEKNGDGVQTLTAEYVVGSDGSRSTVREQAGIEQTRTDYDKLMALLVFRSKELHERVSHFPKASFFRILHPDMDGYWRFLGRVDVGEGWFLHAPAPPDSTRENFDANTFLIEALGLDCHYEFDYVGFWDLRVSIAKTYRQGRIFIAGDACHSHPPYGGYGVNTGLEDARNLGWKLAAMLQGWGGEGLLNSYGEERLPVFQSTSSDFIEKYIENARHFFANYHPDKDADEFQQGWEAFANAKGDVHKFLPHYEGSKVVAGEEGSVSGAVGEHMVKARAGHHLTPQTLSDGKNVYEMLGIGFTLLAFNLAEDMLNEFEQAAQALNMPLQIVHDTSVEVAAAYESSLILVRPDQFVAWVADDGSYNLEAVLKQAIGQ